MQKIMETEQLSGISALHQQKKPFAKKVQMTIFRDVKGQFGFIN
jgi:hypothetical protein